MASDFNLSGLQFLYLLEGKTAIRSSLQDLMTEEVPSYFPPMLGILTPPFFFNKESQD